MTRISCTFSRVPLDICLMRWSSPDAQALEHLLGHVPAEVGIEVTEKVQQLPVTFIQVDR